MASSDDKPEEKAGEPRRDEAKTPSAKQSRRKAAAKKSGETGSSTSSGSAKAKAKADDAKAGGTMAAASTEAPLATDKAKATGKPEEKRPQPVDAQDAPSGDKAEADAPLEPSDPLKPGPTEKRATKDAAVLEPDAAPNGKPGSESEPEPQTAEVPDLESPPEPAAAVPQAVSVAPAPARLSMVPLLVGGIIAGLIGFAAAWYVFGRDGSADELSARLNAQAEAAKSLEASVAAKAASADLTALGDRVAALESAPAADTSATDDAVAEQGKALDALSERVEALEKAPVEGTTDPVTQAALAAYGREVEALRKEMADQTARINAALEAAKETEAQAAKRQEDAAAATARATEQRALLDIQKALGTGSPYSEALEQITSVAVPPGLSAQAAEGVPTLDALKAGFPPAARKALKVAREETASDTGGGFGAWITRQVGARSLEPKEGGDPDAVLSRAEAALNAGDIAGVLKQIAALPPDGQEAMAGWVAEASRRNDAVTGAETLSATLASN